MGFDSSTNRSYYRAFFLLVENQQQTITRDYFKKPTSLRNGFYRKVNSYVRRAAIGVI